MLWGAFDLTQYFNDLHRATCCRTETCVAPRHVDKSRDFYFIFFERAAWGGGGGEDAARFFL